MANEVKFVKASTNAFVNLSQKDPDTLYFVNSNGDFSPQNLEVGGLLYLGEKLISKIDYNNPVSPNSQGLIAGANITANTIVFKSTDGFIYPITNTTAIVDEMWGLAICSVAVSQADTIPGNSLLQQGTVAQLVATQSPYYAIFTRGSNGLTSANIITQTKPNSGTIVYIGVGDASGNHIAVDFSNHIFVSLENSVVTYINGLAVSLESPLNTPITPYSSGYTAGYSSPSSDSNLVLMGTDGKLYPYTRTNVFIDIFWGVALVYGSFSANDVIEGNRILQSGKFSYSGASGIYYLPLIREGQTGGYKSLGILQRGPSIQQFSRSYFYIGKYNSDDQCIDCNFTNHLPLNVNKAFQVDEIAGMRIINDTPLASTASAFTAGMNINAYDLVFKCVDDSKIYSILDTSHAIDTSFGIWLLKENYTTDNAVDASSLLQQGWTDFTMNIDATQYPNLSADNLTPETKCYLELVKSRTDGKLYSNLAISQSPSTGIYIYIGQTTDECSLLFDNSNHQVMDLSSGQLTSIDEFPIYQSAAQSDLQNPVAYGAPVLEAGTTIPANSFVFKNGLNLYPITVTNVDIDTDWGIALYTESAVTDDRIDSSKLIQNGFVINPSGITLDVTTNGQLVCLPVTHSVYGGIRSSGKLAVKSSLQFTYEASYIYIGTAIYDDNGVNWIAVDCSNHNYLRTFAGKLLKVNSYPVDPVSWVFTIPDQEITNNPPYVWQTTIAAMFIQYAPLGVYKFSVQRHIFTQSNSPINASIALQFKRSSSSVWTTICAATVTLPAAIVTGEANDPVSSTVVNISGYLTVSTPFADADSFRIIQDAPKGTKLGFDQPLLGAAIESISGNDFIEMVLIKQILEVV